MKRIFVVAASALTLALMFATDSYAQVIGKDIKTKNEISVSYGALSNSDWIEAFGEVVTVMFGGKTKQSSAVGPISAEYFYRVSPVVAVGAVGVAASFKEDMLCASGCKFPEACGGHVFRPHPVPVTFGHFRPYDNLNIL